MTRRVRLAPMWPRLHAVYCADTGLYLAALLTEDARAAYVARWGWEVVQ